LILLVVSICYSIFFYFSCQQKFGDIAILRYNQAAMEKSYIKLKKLSEKNGDIEFQAEVPVELLTEYSLAALAELAEILRSRVPQG